MSNPTPTWRIRIRKTKTCSRSTPATLGVPARPEIGIYLGLCTHLGCSPKYYGAVQPEDFDENWRGGFFCPCHGSRFDLAGRVVKAVPAPDNLEVPPHRFASPGVVVIGEDEEIA